MLQARQVCQERKIDALVEFVKSYRAKGLAYMAVEADGSIKSSFAKFMKEEEIERLKEGSLMQSPEICFLCRRHQ